MHILNDDEVINARSDYTQIVSEADAEKREFTQVMFKAYPLSPPNIAWEIDSSMKTWMDPTSVRLWQMYVITGSPMHQREKIGDYRLDTTIGPGGGPSFQISQYACHGEHPDPRTLLRPMRPWVPVGYYHAPT